jgi:hypothetical protein
MRPNDVDECVDLIATHPVIGKRYDGSLDNLRRAWQRLLGSDSMLTAILVDAEQSPAPICFVGVAVCVHDEFLSEVKASPCWVGPELVRRIVSGASPVLSDRQLREANSADGLNNLGWEGCIRHGWENHSDVFRGVMSAYLETHRGFRWKEVIASQMVGVAMHWALQTGGLLWNPAQGRYVDGSNTSAEELTEKPHLVGVTRDLEVHRPASWVGELFSYRPPRCGFSRSEQQLLRSALIGATDEELAEALHISRAAVKKRWLSIYRRSAASLPGVVKESAEGNDVDSKRGKEKKRRLLMYLREHPEELRPVSSINRPQTNSKKSE